MKHQKPFPSKLFVVIALTAVTIATDRAIVFDHDWVDSDSVQNRVNSTMPQNKNIVTTNRSVVHRVGSPERPLVIINQLGGEMGNNLAKFAYSHGLKRWLEDDYNITSVILHRHQENKKWPRARANVVRCFPNLRYLDFSMANTKEFVVRTKQQNEWLGDERARRVGTMQAITTQEMVDSLDFIRDLLLHKDESLPPAPPIEENANITLPFVNPFEMFGTFTAINDRYYEELRSWFEYDLDNEECCKALAEPDEILFHLRNFKVEVPKSVSDIYGFEELSPNKTAKELFGHLKKGDKIAITSRFLNHVQPYVDAFQQNEGGGPQIRVMNGQSTTQDFCFLMSAQRELVGVGASTFVTWAAYLGNATRARIYTVKSPGRLRRAPTNYHSNKYNYTNQELAKKMSFPLYNAESQDRRDNRAQN